MPLPFCFADVVAVVAFVVTSHFTFHDHPFFGSTTFLFLPDQMYPLPLSLFVLLILIPFVLSLSSPLRRTSHLAALFHFIYLNSNLANHHFSWFSFCSFLCTLFSSTLLLSSFTTMTARLRWDGRQLHNCTFSSPLLPFIFPVM